MKNTSSDSKKIHISARAKLVPAIAMLSTSAIMLSTSTYAWFTMNKEVEITGLQMTATASESIEISLGKIDSSAVSMPGDTEEENKYWSNSFAVSNYYEKIGLIQPASSVDGINFFYALDATSQGKEANKFAAVPDSPLVKTVLRSDVDKAQSSIATYTPADGETYEPGYYLDIPFYVRTTMTSDSDDTLFAAVKITDNSAEGNENLYKAVRVAIIDANDNASKIFAEETANDYYSDGQAINAAGDGSNDSRASVLGTVSLIASDNTHKGADTGLVFSQDKANGSNFRKGAYIIRVWLEGESESCYDANSGQSWNIDLKFGLNEEDIIDFADSTPEAP